MLRTCVYPFATEAILVGIVHRCEAVQYFVATAN